jgi:hypothetical protein
MARSFEESWALSRGHLDTAFRYLREIPAGPSLKEALKRYADYLENNELELAMDELGQVAEMHEAQFGVWRSLSLAAENMKLADKADFYRGETGSTET